MALKKLIQILLVISDDLSTEFVGQNMISLANDGVNFSFAYSNYPVCGPSRSSFLSGYYPDQTQMYRFADKGALVDSIPMTLSKYMKTASFGKVFHEPYTNGYDNYYRHWTESDSQGSAQAYYENSNSNF